MIEKYRSAQKHLVCCLLPLVLAASVFAGEQEFTTKVYAPDQDVHEKEVKVRVQLPDGWRYTEHNGQQFIIGGKDVYGFITIGYHPLSIFNISRQFGTPEPPKTEVNGQTVMHKDGAFARKLSPGWIIRASLLPYPEFKGKDMTSYNKAFIEIIGTADVTLPEKP